MPTARRRSWPPRSPRPRARRLRRRRLGRRRGASWSRDLPGAWPGPVSATGAELGPYSSPSWTRAPSRLEQRAVSGVEQFDQLALEHALEGEVGWSATIHLRTYAVESGCLVDEVRRLVAVPRSPRGPAQPVDGSSHVSGEGRGSSFDRQAGWHGSTTSGVVARAGLPVRRARARMARWGRRSAGRGRVRRTPSAPAR